ncbi:MAG: EAL domain-containing protein [Marinisporobacter sp.]|jgi:diguanylate cyclase (GGDEF)-like protein|nr:EAL domain-containing protein [Marinisporobacter sp.]
MGNKIIKEWKKTGIISGLILLLFIITIIFRRNHLEVDYDDFIVEGIYFIFIVFCFLVALEFKIKYLTMGCVFLCILLFSDMLDELRFIPIPKWQDYLIEELFLGLGIVFIAYGFYKSLEEKENLLNQLRYFAFYDRFTGLPNRRYIEEYLTISINESIKDHTKVGVLFIDLDKFKLINDTLGHYFGDDLLKLVADKLGEVIKDQGTIARLGGDEFIIVMEGMDHIDPLKDMAKKIIDLFQKPFIVKEIDVHITCSIGISITSDEEMSTEILFKNADVAMYQVKEEGGNNYKLYNKTMDEKSKEKLHIAEAIRYAIKKKEWILHYQPKVNIQTGEVSSLEALIRWNHPKLGLTYPNYFIHVAEETGLIKHLDLQVLELACLQIKDWTNRGVKPVNISVNISAKLFNESKFLKEIEEIFNRTGVDTSLINIEITETASMKDTAYTNKILKALKEKYIKISLDDFGKGYSSLTYLKNFPIDVLKIDKLFVDGINKDKRDELLIKAAVSMAKALKIKVVCEGVETKEQLEFLRNIHCDEYQGYLFSKPVPIEEIERILYKRKNI